MDNRAESVSGKAAGGNWLKTAGSGLWMFFNSLKLTLTVLIALAVFSILGTIIEQNQPVEAYLGRYGEGWTKMILAVRLNDMYHSHWFTSLLVVLTLNIIVCTLERFPPKWRSLIYHKPLRLDPKLIEKCAHHESALLEEGAASIKEKVIRGLKKKRFKVAEVEAVGGCGLYAWKGSVGRLGSDATHVSLLLILIGAIVGSFMGFKDFKGIYVGGTIDVPNAEFSIRLDKFWIEHYETGQIRQYNSLLTVVENGKDVLSKQIWVNEPLYYKGIRFYQSSFGAAWDRIDEGEFAFLKKGKEEPETPVTVRWASSAGLPGSPYTVKLAGYVSDFAYDESTKQVVSRSGEADNPAAMVEISKNGTLVGKSWIFLKYPRVFPSIPDSGDHVVFTGYRGVMYSGISMNKDPGTNIVWAGSIVMGLGFYLAFFVYHRRVWIYVREAGGSTELRMGGIVNKNSFVFEKELKDIMDGVKGLKAK
ncbi:MAG: cytochrome c biogenesis protein ResB [Deltaproteobacteria bacterium]|nr:cytochrome c biogenesis protein ResB [Deltaproteobacteria bacterium]